MSTTPRRALRWRTAFACLPLCLLGLLTVSPPVEAQDFRLDDRAVPLAQAVRLKLDPAQAGYSGAVRIALEVRRGTDTLYFNAEGMTFDRVELIAAEGSARPLETEEGEWGTITARAAEAIEPGKYTLEIDFQQTFNTRAVGLYRMEQGGEPYLFTQFQAIDARKAFPCWDQPEFKIPFTMTLEVPAALEALTNTPIARQSTADGWKTLVFEATPPTPSYLLALAVGPLEAVEIPGLSIPGRVVTTKGQSHLTRLAVELTPPILKALEAYFGRPYPYAKLDLIAVPEFWPGAMENPGAITFADRILLVDGEHATLGQRRALARITAHELAHIWFGDLVTMTWWDDLWLNESFADWMGDKITAAVYPELKAEVSAQGGVEGVLQGDARPSTTAIRKTVDSPSDVMEDLGLAYSKGKEVLGMVEQWIGEDAFRKGVNQYIGDHAWGNAVAEDLWNALSKASGKDVRRPLVSYIGQPGYPLLSVRVETVEEGPRLVLTQERFHNDGVEITPQQWTVPVNLKLGFGDTVETRSVLLDSPSVAIPLSAVPEWVLPNAGASGYYRWQVPEAMLRTMAEGADGIFTPVERVAFLGNAGALLDAGTLGGDDYLAILNAFADDPEPQVISALMGGLGKVRGAFVPDDLLPAFHRYVQVTLGPVLERYGLEPRAGEEETISALRPQLITWLGWLARDEAVEAFARRQAARYLEDPAAVDPSLAGTALRIAAREGDGALFDNFQKRFEEASNPTERGRFLGALGAFEAPALRQRALAYALAGPLRPNEIFAIPFGQGGTDAEQDRIFAWILDQFEVLAERMPPRFVDFMPRMGGGCSLERLRATEDFFAVKERRTEGAIKNLAKVADQVHDCVHLRQREGAVVRRYLEGLAPGGTAAGSSGS
jgi:cytosol alanyl aminopeptidase